MPSHWPVRIRTGGVQRLLRHDGPGSARQVVGCERGETGLCFGRKLGHGVSSVDSKKWSAQYRHQARHRGWVPAAGHRQEVPATVVATWCEMVPLASMPKAEAFRACLVPCGRLRRTAAARPAAVVGSDFCPKYSTGLTPAHPAGAGGRSRWVSFARCPSTCDPAGARPNCAALGPPAPKAALPRSRAGRYG